MYPITKAQDIALGLPAASWAAGHCVWAMLRRSRSMEAVPEPGLTIKHLTLKVFTDQKPWIFVDQQLYVTELLTWFWRNPRSINGLIDGGKSTETMSSPPKIWGVCCKFSLQASLRHKLLKSVSSRRKPMEVRDALRICRCLGCAEGPAKKSCPKPMPDQVPCAKRDSCFHPPSFLL